MTNYLYPDAYLDSSFVIDYEGYYQKGYRAVLFDIDNTLVPHGAPADERSIALFERLHKIGFKTCLISNNKEPRVKSFCDQVGSTYIFKAGKPKTGGYRQAMDMLGSRPDNTLFIGDQIFTDVVGARLCGLHTIMVKPIHPKEEIQIVLKRIPEKAVLFFYKRKTKRVNRKKRKGKD